MKTRLILFLGTLLWSVNALAQHHQTLYLDSCKSMALRNQTRMKNALLDSEQATLTKKAAFTKFFPQVVLNAGGFHSANYLVDIYADDNGNSTGANLDIHAGYDGKPLSEQQQRLQDQLNALEIDFDIEQQMNDFADRFTFDAHLEALDHGAFVSAMLTQPVFMGGRIYRGNQLAQVGVEASKLQQDLVKDEVELSVEKYYWMVYSLQSKMSAINQGISLLDTLQKDASAGVNAGLIGKNDLLKVKLKLNELKASKVQLEHGIQLTTMLLCQYVGLEYNPNYEYLLVDKPYSVRNLPQKGLKESVENRTESKLLDLSVKAEWLQKQMLLGETLPQVAIGATYGYSNLLSSVPSAELFKTTPSAIVFATIQVPITAWWENSHNLKKQQLALQKAENEREDKLQMMELQTQQAWNELVEAKTLVELKRQACSDAEENMKEVKTYYDAGMETIGTYLEAQTMYQQTQSELIDQEVVLRMKELQYSQFSR